jgi:hypothetical protein
LYLCPSDSQYNTDNNLSNKQSVMVSSLDKLYRELKHRSTDPSHNCTVDFMSSIATVINLCEPDLVHKDDVVNWIYGDGYLMAFKNNPTKQTTTLHSFSISELAQHAYETLDLVSELNIMQKEGVQFAAGHIFKSTKTLCLAFEVTLTTIEDVETATTRYIYLTAFQIGSLESIPKIRLVAKTKHLVPELYLCSLPNYTCRTRMDTSRVSVEFMLKKSRIFAIFRPSSERLPSIIIFVLYHRSFIPITGNRRECPGLYVFDDRTMTIYARRQKSQDRLLYTSKFEGYSDDGYTRYTIARLEFVF